MGGGERHLATILEQLVQRGHSATVLTLDAARQPDMSRPAGAGLPAHEVRRGVRIHRMTPGGGPLGAVAQWLNTRRGGYRLLQLLSGGLADEIACVPSPLGFLSALMRSRIDVVLATNWWSNIPLFGTLVAHHRRIPVVGLPLLHITRPWASRPALHKVIRLADCTVGLTASERIHQEALGAVRSTVIGCGLDMGWGESTDAAAARQRLGLGRHPVIASVGRQDERKGTPTLLAAMQRVWQRQPEARLLLAGQRSHRDRATAAALEHLSAGERARVVTVDDFDDADAPDLFAACDVLAQPSVEESFGLVLLEAWMMGRPVIGADIPATRDVISNGEDGLIVPPMDPSALAEAILGLLGSPERRIRMGQRGRAKVLTRYTVPVMVDAWEALLREVSAQRPV